MPSDAAVAARRRVLQTRLVAAGVWLARRARVAAAAAGGATAAVEVHRSLRHQVLERIEREKRKGHQQQSRNTRDICTVLCMSRIIQSAITITINLVKVCPT